MDSPKQVIELSGVAIFYKNSHPTIPILRDIDLVLHTGEVLYVIGRVGSGKSSLLRTLYGEIPLRVGNGRVCGINLRGLKNSKIPVLRRRLGVIFQEHNLLNDYTVFQNLEFVLRATGWDDTKQINRRIAEVLELVGMGDWANTMPLQISGGQRQKVCIARALLNSPALIIADEPTGNLDPASTYEIMELLGHIAAVESCAVILSTHNAENLRNFPNRTLLCHGGVLQQAY